MSNILLVALGGACGAVARYLIGNVITRLFGSALPYGTYIINIFGCFCMGVLMTLIVDRQLLPAQLRLLLCVGFLGGFTTFSSFGYETLKLLSSGHTLSAAAYASGSVLFGVLAAALGVQLAK